MQAHTVQFPESLSQYLSERLNGHFEQLNDYLVGLVEQDKQNKAVAELRDLLSDPLANTPSNLSMVEIRQRALARLHNDV
jgi:hypothetical protein